MNATVNDIELKKVTLYQEIAKLLQMNVSLFHETVRDIPTFLSMMMIVVDDDGIADEQMNTAFEASHEIHAFMSDLDMNISLAWVRFDKLMVPHYKFCFTLDMGEEEEGEYVHLGMEISAGDWELVGYYSSTNAFSKLTEDGWDSLLRSIRWKQLRTALCQEKTQL